MTLKEYIASHNVKNKFIALYNNSGNWIISCMITDARLTDYLKYTITEKEISGMTICLTMPDYDSQYQLAQLKILQEVKAMLGNSTNKRKRK